MAIDLVFAKSPSSTDLVFGSDTDIFIYNASGSPILDIGTVGVSAHGVNTTDINAPLTLLSGATTIHGVNTYPPYTRETFDSVNFKFNGVTYSHNVSTDFIPKVYSPIGILNITTSAAATLVEMDRGRVDLNMSTDASGSHAVGVNGSVNATISANGIACTLVSGDASGTLFTTTSGFLRHGTGGYASSTVNITSSGSYIYTATAVAGMTFAANITGISGVSGTSVGVVSFETSAASAASIIGYGYAVIETTSISYTNTGFVGYGNAAVNISTDSIWQYDVVGTPQVDFTSQSNGNIGVSGDAKAETSYSLYSVSAFGNVLVVGAADIGFSVTQFTTHGVKGSGNSAVSIVSDGEQRFIATGKGDISLWSNADVAVGVSSSQIIPVEITTSGVGTAEIFGGISVPVSFSVTSAAIHGVTGYGTSDIFLIADGTQQYRAVGDVNTNFFTSASVGVIGVSGNLSTNVLYPDTNISPYDWRYYAVSTVISTTAYSFTAIIGNATTEVSFSTNAKTGTVGAGDCNIGISAIGGIVFMGSVESDFTLTTESDSLHGVNGYAHYNLMSNSTVTPVTVADANVPTAITANIDFNVFGFGNAVCGVNGNGATQLSISANGDYRTIGGISSHISFISHSSVGHGISGYGVANIGIEPTYIFSNAYVNIIGNADGLFAVLCDGNAHTTYTTIGISGSANYGIGNASFGFGTDADGGSSVYAFGAPISTVNVTTQTNHGVTGFANNGISFSVASIIDHMVGGTSNTSLNIVSKSIVGHGVRGTADVGFIIGAEDIRLAIIQSNNIGFREIPGDMYDTYSSEQFLQSAMEMEEFNIDLELVSNLQIRHFRLIPDIGDLSYIKINDSKIRLVGNYKPIIIENFTYKINDSLLLKSAVEPDHYLALIEYHPELGDSYQKYITFEVGYVDVRDNYKTAILQLNQLVYWNMDYSLKNFYNKLNKGKI